MKLAKLLHNTGAGDEDHEADELLTQIRTSGFECRYSSIKKKELKKIGSDFDFLIAAGGDGTLREITRNLLAHKKIKKPLPIGLLPLGTANNIAKTLGLSDNTDYLIDSWHHPDLKSYDVGYVLHKKEKFGFFLESFGYGIFPRLMKEMKPKEKENKNVDKISVPLELLNQLVHTYKPRHCQIDADGKDYSGNYLLVEVMNAKSIGPNLILAEHADPGDGLFELVLVAEEKREEFAAYVLSKLEGNEEPFHFPIIKAEKITLCWDGKDIHMDDELVKLKKNEIITIEPRQNLLQFLLPGR